MRPYFWMVLAFAGMSACNGCLGCKSPVDDSNSNLPSACSKTDPLIAPQKLDILFVIDNSSSMIEEQQGVAKALVAFMTEVSKSGGVSTDFHLGVIDTSVYQYTLINGISHLQYYSDHNGKLRPVPEGSADGGILVLADGGIPLTDERMLLGTDPDLIPKLSRLVQQGTHGSGQETPYEAVRLALIDQSQITLEQGGNGGFFRDRARLLVVVLSDEDDCSEEVRPPLVHIGDDPSVDDCLDQQNSETPVSEYFRIFTQDAKDTQGNTREIIWGEIAAVSTVNKMPGTFMDPNPPNQIRNIDCPTSNAPAYRHFAMAQNFDPSLQNLDSICRLDVNGNPDYVQTLINLADLANIAQVLEVNGVPDPRMLQMAITRADGNVQLCTQANGGLGTWDAPTAGQPGRIHFNASCKRRADDRAIAIKMLCAN
ncbi:MAG: VWA domain-containing protein [Myxococcaceae bacterium]